MGKVLMGDNT